LRTQWPRLDEGGLDQLDAWLVAHSQARLVMLDTLTRIRPRRARNGDLFMEDYAVGEQLKALADRHGVAVLVIHHLRKAAADDPLDTITGTLGLSASADGILILRRQRGRMDAALLVAGRDLEDADLPLHWDRDITWALMPGTAEEYRLSQERQAVLEVLRRASAPMGPKAIATALGSGANYSALRMLLSQMLSDGQITSPSRGGYVLNTYAPTPTVNGDPWL